MVYCFIKLDLEVSVQNGLLEVAPFMTIRVSQKDGPYPTPVDFMDMDENDLRKRLAYVHGECGGDLDVTFIKTGDPETTHFSIMCKKCGAEIKMHTEVFWGEVSSLSTYNERWVAGAYQFVQVSSP